MNLPRYGKKSLQIRDTWPIFRLHVFLLAWRTVLLDSHCYLECFLELWGTLLLLFCLIFSKLVLYAGYKCIIWEKMATKVWIVLKCTLRGSACK